MSDIDSFLSDSADQSTSIDSFLGSSAPKPSTAKRVASDIGTSLKRGVQALPGVVTGVADLGPAAAFGVRPFNTAADVVGDITGFKPGQWAKQAQLSPENEKAARDVGGAWAGAGGGETFGDQATRFLEAAPDIAKAYARNPAYVANQVAESLPASLAGGVVSRPLVTAGRAVIPAAEGAAARMAPGYLERKVGTDAASEIAGGVGEGVVQAGSALDQSEGPDQQRNALAALGSGVGDAVIAAGAGRVAHKLGLETSQTALAKGFDQATGALPPVSALHRILGGAINEAVLQELPQSIQEKIWENYAEGKPLLDGAIRQGIEGAIAGGLMGGAFNIRGGGRAAEAAPDIAAPGAATQPPASPIAPAGPLTDVAQVVDAAAVPPVPGIPTPAGDPIRAAKLPEGGPLSRGVNTLLEGEAQAADVGQPVPAPVAGAMAGVPSVDALPGQQQSTQAGGAEQSDDRAAQGTGGGDAAATRPNRQQSPAPSVPVFDPTTGQISQPQRGTFPTLDAVQAFISQARLNGSARIGKVTPVQLADGQFSYVREGEPGYEQALATSKKKPTLADRRAKAQQEKADGQPQLPGVATPAAVAAGSADGAGDLGGRSGGDLGRVAPDATGGVSTGAAAPAPSVREAAPVDAGSGQAPAVAAPKTLTERRAQAQGKPQPNALGTTIEGRPSGTRGTTAADLLPKTDPVAKMAGEAIDPEWSAFTAESGTKGIPRADMPQIKAEHRGAMVQFLKGRGITHEQEHEVDAATLKPTQAEFSPGKAAKARGFEGSDRAILVSSDNHVLDGHHQWVAALADKKPVRVIRLDAPIDTLLADVREFPSATTAEGATTDVTKPASGTRAQAEEAATGEAPAPARSDAAAPAGIPAAGSTAVEAAGVAAKKKTLADRRRAAQAVDSAPATNASAFIPAPDGSLDYGTITPEMGKVMRREAGSIRLRQGDKTQGLVHIEARHLDQFRRLGFDSVPAFVASVARDFTAIYKRAGSALDVVLDDGQRGRLVVQLELAEGGAFYDVKTASPIRSDQFKNAKPLWERAGTSASDAESIPPSPRGQSSKTVALDHVPPQASGAPALSPAGASGDASRDETLRDDRSAAGQPTVEKQTLADRRSAAKAAKQSAPDIPVSETEQEKPEAVLAPDAPKVSADTIVTGQAPEATPADDAKPAELPPAASKTPTVDSHLELFKGIRAGTVSPDDFKAMYRRVRDGKESIVAELNTRTKDELARRFGDFRSGTAKGEIVEWAYKALLHRFALGKDFGPNSYSMGQEKAYEQAKQDALDAIVEGQTAESLAEYAAEAKAEFDAEMDRRSKLIESVKDPKTLEDFRTFIRIKGDEGKTFTEARMMLTPEQRALMDELAATVTRSRRKVATDEQRTAVRVAGQTVDGDIIATKHTKKGTDLYVVKLAERVSREDYETLNAGAKRIGGYYSSFRGAGAVPGFQFITREQAQAFVTLAGGDNAAAVEAAKERRDAFQDDRSQSAAERLTEMADRLDERADESLGRERKANTERRARFAANAEASASADKALAQTMRNIAQAITGGAAKWLDRVRQKTQVELLQGFVRTAKGDELRTKYPAYVDQERHSGEAPTGETADYAEFPNYTAYRSDLASLGRQLLEVDGTKKLGQQIMKVADDVSDAFTSFAKEPGNLLRLSTFSMRSGEDRKAAIFPDRESAGRAIKRSGLSAKAIVFPEKRGVNRIIMSPSEAIAQGVWKGDGDKRISLDGEFGAELVEKIGRAARRGSKVSVPWQFETAYDRRKALARMGIETPAEFRAALREFIGLRESAAAPDKVKQLERAMVGRRNDGMDFFPTPESVADEMVAAADIQPGMRVLEPSAGMGHIAERIREAEVEPEVGEISNERRELLEAKGFAVVARDFMDFKDGGYDRILMNPPFSDGRDIQHVRHAYSLLKPGGRLVALMGESAFTNQNKRATEFREWLESVGGTEEKLAEGTFNDPSLPVNTGANARMVVIDKANELAPSDRAKEATENTESLSIADDQSAEGPITELAALRALLQNDDLFALPRSNGTTVDSIAADIDPEIKVTKRNVPGEQRYDLTFPDGNVVHMTERKPNPYGPTLYGFDQVDGELKNKITDRPGENPEDVDRDTEDVFIDASKLTPGGAGTKAYQIAATYAHNTGRIFIGDPTGLSDEALRRRSEQMLSSALKFGTTAHLAPHPRQVEGGAKLGVPPLKWVYGDDIGNIRRLVDLNLAALENRFPDIKKVDFNAATGQFVDAQSGKPISRLALGRRVNQLRSRGAGPVAEAEAGRRTVARGVVLRSLLREEGRAGEAGGRRDGLLDRLARVGSNAGAATKGIFYDRADVADSEPSLRLADTPAKVDTGAYAQATPAQQALADKFRERVARSFPGTVFHAVAASGGTQAGRAATGADERVGAGNPAPDRSLQAVQTVAKRLFGHEVVFVKFDGPTLFNGAMSDAIPGVVFINVESKRPHMAVLGHELLHQLRSANPTTYNVLKMRLERLLRNPTAHYAALQAKYDQAGKSSAAVKFEEELHADIVGDFFMDPQFWQDLARDRPGLFKRVVSAVLKFLDDALAKMTGDRPFGTDKIITDIRAARAAVVDAFGQFSGTQVGAMTGQSEGISLSLADSLAGNLNSVRDINLPAGYKVGDLFNSSGKVGWWHKTVGTMHNLAQRSPEFKRVYDVTQDFINDTSYYASEAANLAPTILPKLETIKDIRKQPLSAADTQAIAAPIFEGTLTWARDDQGNPVPVEELARRAQAISTQDKGREMLRRGVISDNVLRMWQGLPLDQYTASVETRYQNQVLRAGVVWSDAELRSMFKLTEPQIKLYREFRAAVDKSLTELAISDMVRFGGSDVDRVRQKAIDSGDVNKAAEILRDHLYRAAEFDAERAGMLNDTGTRMIEKAERATELMKLGYAPLSRYGQYTLDIVTPDGERAYFGMFETPRERSRMRRQMAANFPDAQITEGTVSEEAYKLFAGVSPETLELFGDMLGLEAQGTDASSQAFQTYLKVAKTNRSAMKRLIQRKGIAGFSEDAGRVLAGFVYSNGRQTSTNLHAGEMTDSVAAISQQQGELKDAAVRLNDYVRNPQEEAQGLRGLLFAQYLGGSVASAMVNALQPAQVTFPYLSQYLGVRGAASQMVAATRDAFKRFTGDRSLDAALRKAEEEGIVSPQEVHQLMAQARGRGTLTSGDGTRLGDALAAASNTTNKVLLAWGKVFGVAEQFNRRVTFIAAYRTAVEKGIPDPAGFAAQAIADTQFTYNKGNKPEWARGAIGSTLFTFKQYSVNYVELISRMAKSGPEGRKAALLALGVLFLMAGASGLPGADDLDDLIDGAMQRLGYSFDSKVKRRQFFADTLGLGLAGAQFIERGLSGLPGAPIDVSGRLGLGNLLPGTGLFTKKDSYATDIGEVFGPAGDLAKRTFKAAGQVLGGDVGGALESISPVAAQNAIKAKDMLSTGMYRDQGGKKVIDVDGYDAAMKAIGFQPNDVARVQTTTREVANMVSLNKLREKEITAQWAQAIVEKNPDAIADARKALLNWNTDNPESPIRIKPAQIQQQVKNALLTREQRLQKSAPKEIRAEVARELAASR